MKSNNNVKINVRYFGSTAPASSGTTTQSLQYYVFSDKQAKSIIDKNICKVHSCEKSNIIPFGYL